MLIRWSCSIRAPKQKYNNNKSESRNASHNMCKLCYNQIEDAKYFIFLSSTCTGLFERPLLTLVDDGIDIIREQNVHAIDCSGYPKLSKCATYVRKMCVNCTHISLLTNLDGCDDV